MHNEFMAIIERASEWFIAYCPEVSGANGQGRTKDEARESLAHAVALILEDRREDGLRGVPFVNHWLIRDPESARDPRGI